MAGNPPQIDKFKNAQNGAQATKQLALSWFRKYKSFSTTVPHKSYVQALKNPVSGEKFGTRQVPPISKNVCKNTSNNCISLTCVATKPVSKPSHCNGLSTVAGVPTKYGKCVPAKYLVQKPPTTVLLHNKFHCLQDLSDSQDNGVHNEIHMIKSVPIHSDTSVLSNADYANIGRHWKPQLASQEKYLEGNKNEIGSLDGFNAMLRNDNKSSIYRVYIESSFPSIMSLF